MLGNYLLNLDADLNETSEKIGETQTWSATLPSPMAKTTTQ